MSYFKNISYDANFSYGQHRGMGKYINSFMQILQKRYNITPKGLLTNRQRINTERYSSFGFGNYVLWEQFSLLRYRNKTDGLVIFPYNTAPLFLKPSHLNVLILHDIIFLNNLPTPSLKQKIGKLYRSFVVPRVARKFKHVVTVSEHSKLDIIKQLGLEPDNISVIPNAIELTDDYEKFNPDFSARQNVMLHIGGEPEYKNSKSLMYAFAALNDNIKDKYVLKMIGIRDEKTLIEYKRIADELKILDRIFFLGYQTDQEIEILYKTSKLFLFPSKDEGFGIPIIEAMKYGCPLACSNTSCLPEIAGNAAKYFDPYSIKSITDSIDWLLSDENIPSVRNHIQNGYDQVKNFSSKVFEEKIIDWYENNFR